MEIWELGAYMWKLNHSNRDSYSLITVCKGTRKKKIKHRTLKNMDIYVIGKRRSDHKRD